jgi:hypothetical protein
MHILDRISRIKISALPALRSRLMVSDGPKDEKEVAIRAIDERLSPKRYLAQVEEGKISMGDIADMSI